MYKKPLLIFLIIITFLAGLYFSAKYGPTTKEGFELKEGELRCPNLLIQKGSRYYLYNSKVAQVPGVNPISFNTLEDYTEFLDWQRSQGIRCPVLYLQQSYDTQGNKVFKVRPSVSDLYGGLPPSTRMVNPSPTMLQKMPEGQPTAPIVYPNPSLLIDANHDDAPFNTNSYPSFDPSSFYIGRTTPLDAMDIVQENQPVSPNPMDPNWGGASYTQSLVDSGYYAGNEVNIRVA
jgi:hypothetical protein